MQSTLLSFIMTNVFDSNTNIVNDKNNWIILLIGLYSFLKNVFDSNTFNQLNLKL